MEKKYINPAYPHMLHGGDYNPDQWQDYPEVLSEDMRLMQLADCNAMSVGIFAWAALEPEEGKYDFSFLDKTINDVYEAGGRIVLATPSGARPAWMSKKYPEVLRTNADHSVNTHGNRHNHCYTSPVYRKKVREMDRRLAERYGQHPAVLVWHISNEYGGECHCELCKEAFRGWLRAKYGSIENLNNQWWNAFWAHTFSSFDEIDPPSYLGENCTIGLDVDWRRFVTYQTTDFMKEEIKAIREFCPNIPVTTNFMEFYTPLDYTVLAKELDVISWDAYPRWKNDDNDEAVAIRFSMLHDMYRSYLHKPFMLMESTPSHVNWHPYNKLKRPGVHELSSLQAVAHGADTVQYFQWRKSRGSAEQFHGAVVDHVGNENTRVFREVSALGKRLKKLDAIVGSGTESRVAIVYQSDNLWALDNAQGFQRENKKYIDTLLNHYYKYLWKNGINVDVVDLGDKLEGYSLVIAPMLFAISEEHGKKLADYVENGGTLLCTYMTGMVNENVLCYLGGFPGAGLRKVFGIWNEDIDTLYPNEAQKVVSDGCEYVAKDYCEIIHPEGAEVLAEYASDFYSGGAAATVNSYGKGKAYYVAFRDDESYSRDLLAKLTSELGIVSDFDGALPCGVTAHSRTDGENVFVFLQNYTRYEQKTMTSYAWTTAEDGTSVGGELTLKPYETIILVKSK